MHPTEARRLSDANRAHSMPTPANGASLEELKRYQEELEDGIRALQSTDTPGTGELYDSLLKQLEAVEARISALKGDI